MKPILSRATALLAMLVACGLPAPCQEGSASGGRKAVVYSLQDLSGPGASNEYSETITDTVVAAFRSEESFLLVPRGEWEAAGRARSAGARDLIGQPAALAVARELGAAIAVTGSYAIATENGTEQIVVSLECWDVQAAEIVAGVQKKARFNLAFYSALHGWIARLIPEIRVDGAVAPTMKEVGSHITVSTVTFLSPDEDMEVLIAGDTSAGVIAGGRLSFEAGPLPAGTPLSVELRKRGYHSRVVTVPVGREIALPRLQREHRVAGEIDWTAGESLGLGGAIRGYVIPDALFAWFGTTVFVQPPLAPASRVVIHGDISLVLAGYLFSSPDAPIRFTIGAGAGILLSAFSQPGFPLFTDCYLNVVRMGAEVDLGGLALLVRLDTRYSLGVLVNLLGRGWMQDGFPTATVGVVFR